MTTFLSFMVWAILAQNTMTNLILTDADAGSTHDVRQGQTVELHLRENPSTGYRWSVIIEPGAAASIVGSRFVSASAGVGAGGSIAFEIAASQTGAVELRAKLWREWEGESSVTNRYSFTLRVR